MKKVLVGFSLLLLSASTAFGVAFAPMVLELSAPSSIQYAFDGKILNVPVKVSGKSALATFCVYTNGMASSIKKVQNGFLGWHYVNNIDTSIFISPPISFSIGSNEIIWNGKDDDGNMVPLGNYTYYIFAYDNQSPKQAVNQTIINAGGSGGNQAHIQQWGSDGKPLTNPLWYGKYGMNKWVIGYDPADSALIETTSYDLGAGYSGSMALCLQPDDFTKYYLRVGNNDDKIQGVRKLDWIPNGMSTFDVSWGDNGIVKWSGGGSGNIQAGPQIIGDYLWTAENFYYDTVTAGSTLYAIDWRDGTMVKEIDISSWWSDVEDGSHEGQLNGGPNGVVARNGFLFLNCHCSCIKQMVDPTAMDDMDNFYVWTNQNGDYVVDFNSDLSTHPWVCNDYKWIFSTYQISTDNNLFSLVSCDENGAVSWGLLGPDGDGIGYFAYSSDTAGWKWFNIVVDNGGAFDGIYCDNQEIRNIDKYTKYNPGIYWVAQNSIKGVISNVVGVVEAPSVFSVSQNVPNPFNPSTTICFTIAKAGKVTVEVFNVAGQKVDTIVNTTMNAGSHSIIWNASKLSAGVYFYTVKSGNFSKTMKMTLLK